MGTGLSTDTPIYITNGDLELTGSGMNVPSAIYVENGKVKITGSNFNGTGAIYASGDIEFTGSNMKNNPGGAVCIYSANGDIKITGSMAGFCGILYAPNGKITSTGSNQTIKGRVIGKVLDFTGSGLSFTGGTEEFASVEPFTQSYVKLIK